MPLSGRRVLLVDDNEDDRELYATLLRRAGAEVVVVTDAEAAVAAIPRGKFDAAVFDLILPGIRGSEAVVLLRSRGYRGAIVGYSAFLTPDIAELWRAAGCDEVIPKGDQFLDTLVASIADACEHRHSQ